MKGLAVLLLCCLMGLLMVGCGGSGGAPATTTTPATFSIDWPARSRATVAPTSALSAVLTIASAKPDGTNLVMTVNRDSNIAAHTEVYTTPTPVRTGTWAVSLNFFDQAGGGGDLVASAVTSVTILANGSGIGTISVANRVSTVEARPGSFVLVGETAQLTFTAKDSQGNTIAVTPGSAFWSTAGITNALTLTADGIVEGVQPGSADVQVTVDGVTSGVITVVVPSNVDFQNPSFETPALAPNTWVQPGDPSSMWTGPLNWGIANGNSSWGTGGGHTGAQHAFVQASTVVTTQGILHQTVSGFTVGAHYRVTAWIARRNGNVGGNNGAPLSISAGATQILAPTSPPGNGSWVQVTSSTFTATQTSYDFAFTPSMPGGVQDTATLIDDVKIDLMP